MKLKVIAMYEDGRPSTLTLTKEKKIINNGEVFEVDEARGAEILRATFQGKPVAELVVEEIIIEDEAIIDGAELKEDEVIQVVAKEVKRKKK